MFPLAELSLPPLTPALRQGLDLAAEPVLRQVDLAVLQDELAAGRLDPAHFLTVEELATLAGFSFAKRRREWLGGRLAAKAAALAWEGQPLTAAALARWQVANAPDGRPGLARVPTLAGPPAPELSISHSHGRAAALVVARPCGLDLQRVTDTVLRVRERFCTAAESALLRDSDEPEVVRLTLLWTAKEALRKARGGSPLTGFLAMRLTGLESLAAQGWCFRLAVSGVGEYPVLGWLSEEFALAVSLREKSPPMDAQN